MKKCLSIILTIALILLVLPMSAYFTVDAEKEGYYTYTVENGEATIVGVDTAVSGDVIIPSTLGNCPVVAIEDMAFSDYYNKQYNITSVLIPATVNRIGLTAFGGFPEGYSTVEKFYVDKNNATYSNDEKGVLFNKDKTSLIRMPMNTQLIEYKAPDTVTHISQQAFHGCSNLTNVILPEGLLTIDDMAFAMNNFISIKIPDSVICLGEAVFEECHALKSVYIGKGITGIPSFTFSGCVNLTDIIVPNSVTYIGYWAFGYCRNLTNITILDGTIEISEVAFVGCENLTIFGYEGSYVEMYASDNEIPFVTIEKPIFTSGDTNGDSSINNKDLGLLMQYLNNWNVEIVLDAADVNDDGSVNNKDYGLLMQYLNNWNVELK